MRPASTSWEPTHMIETRDRPEEQRREGRHGGEAGHRLRHVAEEPVDALGEDQGLAPLGAVRLDDADPGEGLGQAARDLGVDLRALPEERPQGLEGVEQDQAEEREDRERDQRQLQVQGEQDDEGDHGGQQSPRDLHEAGSDEVADPLGVGHDAGEKGSDLGLVEEGDREPADVPLHAPPHLGDRALGGLAEDLGQGIRGDRLEQRRARRGEDEDGEKLAPSLCEDLVQEVSRHEGDDETGQPVDEQNPETQEQPALASRDELAGVAENRPQRWGLLLLFLFGAPPPPIATGKPGCHAPT